MSNTVADLKRQITQRLILPAEKLKEEERALKNQAEGQGLLFAELKKAATAEHKAKDGEERMKANAYLQYLEGDDDDILD